MTAASDAPLAERMAGIFWYHSIELAPGLVTPGWFDTRAAAGRVPLPRDLKGRRCLDIGTYDGFWAFEMERRGASEVVAVDVLDPHRWDWPAGSPPEVIAEMEERKRGNPGFALAREALGSNVHLEDRSIYELDAAGLGEFDVVFCGSLMLHLRDPIGALERVRAICRGELVLADAVDFGLGVLGRGIPIAELDGIGRPWWWKPSPAALREMVERAGFRVVDGPLRYRMPRGGGQARPQLSVRALRTRVGRHSISDPILGDPHAALRAIPV